MISTFIITILSLLIGYLLGRGITKQDIIDTAKQTTKNIKDTIKPTKVGAFKGLDAKALNRKLNPQLAAEEDEMRKAFKDIGVDKYE